MITTCLYTYISLICFDKGNASTKARGYLRIMHRSDVVAFMHLLLDLCKPLKRLSLVLQDRETTLADVQTNINATTSVLENYIERLEMYLCAVWFYRKNRYWNIS